MCVFKKKIVVKGCDGGFPYLISGKYSEDFGIVEESCKITLFFFFNLDRYYFILFYFIYLILFYFFPTILRQPIYRQRWLM